MESQEYEDEFINSIFMEKEDDDYSYLADEVAGEMLKFSEQLPEDEIFDLKYKLHKVASQLPENFIEVSRIKGQLEIVKGMISFNAILNECKDYLVIAQKLKYAKSNELVNKVDMVGRILNNYLSSKVV